MAHDAERETNDMRTTTGFKRTALAATFAATFAAAAFVPAFAADKVRVGVGGSSSDAPLYLAKAFGLFAQENVDVDIINLDSGAKIIAPLGTGELDVGAGALSVGFYNVLGRGVKLKIVSDRGHTDATSLYQTVFIRKDLVDSGRYKTLKDLKGFKMGYAAPGVTSLSLMNEAAKAAGLSYDDTTPVFMPFPNMVAAFQNKALDGAFLIEPQETVLEKLGVGVRMENTNNFYPNQQISVIFYSEKFATEHKDVALRFMRGWLRGVRAMVDAEAKGRIAPDQTKVLDVISKELNMPIDTLKAIYMNAVNVDGSISRASVDKDYNFFRSKGWVTEPVDLDKVIDMSFAQEANKQLGPYAKK
jgi:NitT/TauT family transport system substrate-binding protein